MGWNCRGWGWAAESIEAMQVVTAAGDVVWCDEPANADLFWAARGSGPGFFGVVTAFRLRTRPRYRELTQTTYVYPPSVAAEVLALAARRAARRAAVGRAGGGRHHAAAARRRSGTAGPALVVDGVSFDGGPGSLRALDSCPVAGRAMVAKVAQPVTIGELRAEQVRANPEGHRYTVDNAYLAGPARRADPGPGAGVHATCRPRSRSRSGSTSRTCPPARCPAAGLPDMALSVQSDLYFASYVVGETPDAGRRRAGPGSMTPCAASRRSRPAATWATAT